MPDILFFCELLSNIKQVSVSIDTQDAQTTPTSVSLHPSRRALTITLGNQTSHLILPIPVDHASKFITPSTSYRLPVAQSILSPKSFEHILESPPVPWDAASLTKELSIHCTTCTTRIVPPGSVKEWKNLPSEFWADLMDLWHCHKPHDENGHEGGKYAGVGRIIATKEIGLVDPMYFLLCPDDCENISEEETGSHEAATVTCSSCNSPLGIVDSKSDGIRLMKWSLSISRDSSGTPELTREFESYTIFQWLSAHFLSLVDNTGQRKFLVKPGASILSQGHLDGSGRRAEEVAEGLHIWVFNPSTLITTARKPVPTRVLKIYYQSLLTAKEIDALGDIEIIYLPQVIYEVFKKHLEEANKILPRDSRTWAGTWKTAWLERF
ncbi:hypothetical protein ABW19_dt0208052 [Dactylella cylindrospora]|nr:hypothetical protein ABW19_dt0208052 [Dactylella cylindrospora]